MKRAQIFHRISSAPAKVKGAATLFLFVLRNEPTKEMRHAISEAVPILGIRATVNVRLISEHRAAIETALRQRKLKSKSRCIREAQLLLTYYPLVEVSLIKKKKMQLHRKQPQFTDGLSIPATVLRAHLRHIDFLRSIRRNLASTKSSNSSKKSLTKQYGPQQSDAIQ